MRLDDIRSPGHVTNGHELRKAVVKAIGFCEITKSSEKAVELQLFFREAIEYLDREIVSHDLPESEKPIVDTSAVSPFDEDEGDDEIPDAVFPAPKEEVFVPINQRGKKK